jgi:hypothetical protein
MTLLGLPFAQLVALFGATGAAIALLYIFRLRPRRVTIPFALLWQRISAERHANSVWRRLRRLVSLLLQLLFIFLIVAALGDPQLSDQLLPGRHIILLVDTSASMQAADVADGTRFDAALAAARQVVRDMRGRDRMMLVQMDHRVTPLTSFSGDTKALLAALGKLRVSETPDNIHQALHFAFDALHEYDDSLLIIIGDGAYDSEPFSALLKRERRPKLRLLSLGSSSNNVAIVAFSARRDPLDRSRLAVFLELHNYRKKPISFDLQLRVDGQLTEVRRLDLDAGESARYACDPATADSGSTPKWCAIRATGQVLEVRLVRPDSSGSDSGSRRPSTTPLDALALDNRAYSVVLPRKRMRVLLVSEGNLFLEAALLPLDNVELHRARPAELTPELASTFDALVLDAADARARAVADSFCLSLAPDRRRGAKPRDRGMSATRHGPAKSGCREKTRLSAHLLWLAPPTQSSTAGDKTKALRDPLITEQDHEHPVMRHITLKDVNMLQARRLTAGKGDTVLASSFRRPLILARERDGRRQVIVGFDVKRSDLPLRIAFPLLVANTIDWFADDEIEHDVSVWRVGRSWHVPLARHQFPAHDGQATAVTPSGRRERVPVHSGRAVIHGNEVGLYTLMRAENRLALAGNLANASESDIAARAQAEVRRLELAPTTGSNSLLWRRIWLYLILAALGLLTVEWLTYNRRITI